MDELREFDTTYIEDTRSEIVKDCAKKLGCKESELHSFVPLKDENGQVYGCSFQYRANQSSESEDAYVYFYKNNVLEQK